MGGLGVAIVTAAGVALTAGVGALGHILSRRSERDDDVREWVKLQLERQDAEISRLHTRVDNLGKELHAEREERARERLQRLSLAAYVRMMWAWIERRLPGERIPDPTGPAAEAMSDG